MELGSDTIKVTTSTSLSSAVFLPPATKLGQGYIFTGVCDSVHRGRVCLIPGGGAWSGGSAPVGPGGDPPGRLLLRAVRILLECILLCACLSLILMADNMNSSQNIRHKDGTSSYPGWIKSPHVVTCHTYFPIGKICHNFIFSKGGGGVICTWTA